MNSGGGGLFGSKPANTGGGGLFGGSNNTGNKSTFFSNNTSSPFGGSGANNSGSATFGSSQPANLEAGTAAINFTGVKDKDHGGDNKTVITLNSITADPSYCTFSLEELRMADYMLKKQGKANFPIGAQPSMNKPATSSFGGGSSSGGGLFGSSNNTSSGGGGLFGSSNAAKPAGGGLFGSSNTASSGGGGLFGSTGKISHFYISNFSYSKQTSWRRIIRIKYHKHCIIRWRWTFWV